MFTVIMAGGSGTRLWPLSRERYPKQFLPLTGESSLFQQAVLRGGLFFTNLPIVIANEEHRFLVAEQLRQMDVQGSILLEPVGRNTAPAFALAAFHALKGLAKDDRGEAALLLVLAADHVIKDTAALQKALTPLLPEVQAGKFGTLGIVPTEAATGCGYIKAGAESESLFAVEQFVEKPDIAATQTYFDESAALDGPYK